MDFTLKKYKALLDTLIQQNYHFLSYAKFQEGESTHKLVILRHDIDKRPKNALLFAQIEAEKNINASYYFRKTTWDNEIVKRIHQLGHEIGYHYENLSDAKGNQAIAIKDFEKTLSDFRKTTPIKTICMHGSPLSKWDNKKLWDTYNYRDYGIIAEPYFDTDFSKIQYLTDTSRKWNAQKENIRDKIYNSGFTHNYKTTQELIHAIKKNEIADIVMINTHPQRWNDSFFPWLKEAFLQKLKNPIKKIITKK